MVDVTNARETTAALERGGSLGSHARLRLSLPFVIIEPLFALSDILIIVAAGALGGSLYQTMLSGGIGDPSFDAGLSLVASLAYILSAHCFGLYRLEDLLAPQQGNAKVLMSWCLAILVLTVVLFLFKFGGTASRGAVLSLFVLGSIGLVLSRRWARRGLRSAFMAGAIRGKRSVVIGTQNELSQFSRHDLLVRFGLAEIERIMLPRSHDAAHQLPPMSDAQINAMFKRVRDASAGEIVLALPWSCPQDVEALLDRLRVLPLPVRLLPDCAMSAVLKRQTSILHRSYLVEVQRAPLSALECAVKRLLDILVAATALFLLSPLLLAAAIAIKLESKGPVIFRQRRHGFSGQSFVIYKLRSMKVLEDGAVVVQAKERDPRVTRVGRVLRQTSIDELPQLLNVLQGHMSIVGPRPHALVHDYEYGSMIANYAFRHHVKPGITGWAQVNGYRGGTPRLELMERRVTLDLWYIDNWSVLLDMYIIVRTCFELIRSRNAY